MRKTNTLKKTKTEYKVVKNSRSKKADEVKFAASTLAVVSFIMVSKVKLCFRECAKIVKIAEDTNCLIEIASGTKSGSSESILSLANLGIVEDKSLVLTIKGENNAEAFKGVSKIINGNAEES